MIPAEILIHKISIKNNVHSKYNFSSIDFVCEFVLLSITILLNHISVNQVKF